jgi:hypothetical protein
MTDRDRDRAEMRALCDQFRREMAREVERTLFNKEACQRIGEIISQAAQQGRSDYAALRR